MRALLTATRQAIGLTHFLLIRPRSGRESERLGAAQRVSLADRIARHVRRRARTASVRSARSVGLLLGNLPLRLALIVTLLVFPWPARPVQAVTFDYALGLHGPNQQLGNSTVVDALDNVYVVGDFYEYMDVDPGPNAVNVISAGNQDVFIAKYSPTGALLWSRNFGAGASDLAYSIATDGANVYVTGTFAGTFNVGGTTLSSAGIFDIFVVMLTADGTYGWVRQVGGQGIDNARGIAVSVTSSTVSVYVTGDYEGTADFDPGPGVFHLTSVATPVNRDTFVLKLNANGNFVWAKRLGGENGNSSGRAIATDVDGNAYVTGGFDGTVDFDPGPGVFNLSSTDSCVFLVKLDANGNFVLARAFACGFSSVGQGVAPNRFGDVYVTGYFWGTADFDPGPGVFNLTSAGNGDIFVLKLDGSGSFVWARRFGADGPDFGYGIAAGAFGDVYVTGSLGGVADFDPGPGQFIIGDETRFSVFVLKLDADGGLAWARAAGGAQFNEGHAIALDAARSVYTTGAFQGTADFDPGPGTSTLTGADSAPDAFIWKLSEDGPTNTVPRPQTAVGGAPLVFSAAKGNQISVAGQEAGSGLGVTLTATHGTLTLAGTTGLTFTNGDGTADATMTFTGRAAAVNAALDGLRYIAESGSTGQASLEVRSFLASQSGPLKPDTDSVLITAHPGRCVPSPRVQVQPAPGGGKLQVTITPTVVNGGTTNDLSELQFGAFQNAKVTLNGQPIASGQNVSLPPGTSVTELTVERVTPGQPTTVPITVVDRCGPWQTSVGGGSAAGF